LAATKIPQNYLNGLRNRDARLLGQATSRANRTAETGQKKIITFSVTFFLVGGVDLR
jgi:hypothetical protein